MSSAAHQAAQIDTQALARYLQAALPGFTGPVTAEKTPTGQSNPTFLLTSPSGRYVLRKKPPGQLLKSAHAVDREYRVMKGLGQTDVPVPRMLLLCEDESVLGTAFFVMDFVDGVVFWNPALPELNNAQRARVYDEQNRALAALHSADPGKIGLADFGRPGSYFARQRDRWTKQYRASETEQIANMEAMIAWLNANEPADDGRVSLVHGDYRLDNMIFANDASRLLAVIDWELSTLGHPFSDLAYQCMQWRLPNRDAMRGLADIDRHALGIPTEEEYIATYCARMRIGAIPHWKFYLAFSFFRLAAIVQGVKKRGLEGNASNPERALKSGEMVPVLAAMGAGVISD
jgi:aminoglycoside phosphotransferase (APT) family kinase protein